MNSDNVNRNFIKKAVMSFPGVHLRMLSRLAGVSLNTAHYHVYNLQKDGEIVCWKEGEYLRAYPPWIGDVRDRGIYPALQQKAARKIMRILKGEGDGGVNLLTNAAISESTGLSKSTVSEYLTLFRDLQLVSRVATTDGRIAFQIEESKRGHVVEILRTLDRNLISKATDNYLDLWEL